MLGAVPSGSGKWDALVRPTRVDYQKSRSPLTPQRQKWVNAQKSLGAGHILGLLPGHTEVELGTHSDMTMNTQAGNVLQTAHPCSKSAVRVVPIRRCFSDVL